MTDNRLVLLQATQARQAGTTVKIKRAIAELRRDGLLVTVAAVSRTAGVSRTSVYARPDLIDAARRSNPPAPQQTPAGAQAPTSTASLRRRLEASQARNRRLTEEISRLRIELAHLLGQENSDDAAN